MSTAETSADKMSAAECQLIKYLHLGYLLKCLTLSSYYWACTNKYLLKNCAIDLSATEMFTNRLKFLLLKYLPLKYPPLKYPPLKYPPLKYQLLRYCKSIQNISSKLQILCKYTSISTTRNSYIILLICTIIQVVHILATITSFNKITSFGIVYGKQGLLYG